MAQSEKKVDESWKEQVTRERQVEQAKSSAEERDGEKVRRPKEPIPAVSFLSLVQDLAINALLCLGEIQDKDDQTSEVDLPRAKYLIDTIGLLEAKTKGNLTDAEDDFLENTLCDLRMRFVHKSK